MHIVFKKLLIDLKKKVGALLLQCSFVSHQLQRFLFRSGTQMGSPNASCQHCVPLPSFLFLCLAYKDTARMIAKVRLAIACSGCSVQETLEI